MAAFCGWLRRDGWHVKEDQNFVDVVAERDGRTLYAEAKGETSSIGLDVDTMFGQILRRMPFDDDPDARFAVVVPERAVDAVMRVQARVLDQLRIEVFAVDHAGAVRNVRSIPS